MIDQEFHRKAISVPSNFVSLIFITLTLHMLYFAGSLARPNHFANPCILCDCFVEYADRDLTIFASPYLIAKNPYESTEDQCLSACLNDKNCSIAMYGFIGGRDIFTCEFYNKIDIVQQKPVYVPFSNIYIKKVAKCPKKDLKFPELEFTEPDNAAKESIFARKNRYIQLWFKQNFFNLG